MKAAALAASAFICGLRFINANASGDDDDARKCTFYLAKSTIENSGLGVFTGIPLEEDDYIGFGDLAIPIVDIDFHAGGKKDKEHYHWLVAEYAWMARETGSDMALEAEDTSAFVIGFGSLPNCHFRLKNVAESTMERNTAGITRADAGIGAFTPYVDRFTYTLSDLEAGSELFVDYGPKWFMSREADMGLVPLKSSYPDANQFLEDFESLYEEISTMAEDGGKGAHKLAVEEAMTDLWDIIKQSPYKSRPLSAIPKSFPDAKHAFNVGIEKSETEQSILPLEYLDEHGKCLDYLQPGNSTIPHAGRGAFATRPIRKDSYISISPLIHIPDRDVLTMYADMIDEETGEETRDMSRSVGKQLLLNYCFGHEMSSMVLCPYGPGTPFINHSSEPNAKIVWSEDPTYHKAEWLNEPVAYFDNVWSTGLSFEYVAIKDINEGDEVFINYGPEWEKAWTNHIHHWQSAHHGTPDHISAKELEQDPMLPIPTYEETDLAGENILAWCTFSRKSLREDSHVWQEPHTQEEGEYLIQRIIDRTHLPTNDSYMYTVEIQVSRQDAGDELSDLLGIDEPISYLVRQVPREAISISQGHYQSEIFVNGVFRHEMMIPDEIFPDAWKNLIP